MAGWHVSTDSYIFTDTIFFVVYEWIFGPGPEALIVLPSVTYVLIVLACLAASFRSLKPSRRNMAALAAIVLLVGLPSLRDPSIHLFAPAAPLLLPDHHAASILFSLIALILLAVLARAERIRDRWGAASVLVLVWAATLGSDPFALVFAFGPAILVLLSDLALVGGDKKQVCLIIIVTASSIIGLFIPILLRQLGGPVGEESVQLRFIEPEKFITNIQAIFFGFLYSADAYIFDRDPLNTATFAHLARLTGWLVGAVFILQSLPRLKRYWKGSLLDRIIITSIVTVALACIFSEQFGFTLVGVDVFDGGEGRIYISPMIILGAVLVARAAPASEAWLRVKTIRSAGQICLVALAASLLVLQLPSALTLALSPAWVKTNPYVEVGRWLEAKHLNYGIGDYWVSSIIRALTGGKVSVNAVIARTGRRLEPYVFDTDAHFYRGTETPMFVLWREGDDPFDWYGVNAKAVEATYGPVARTEYLPGGFVVKILREPPD